ncbi:MAG: MBL fold metallo-hydrolase [Patescibacteria group bacterium]|nr:MBL fold metallo-hydrolase [Patescibacteria group bacterium]
MRMSPRLSFLQWFFGRRRAATKNVPEYVPEYTAPDLARINSPDPAKIQVTWVGHATFLIQVAGLNILTDPIWSERAFMVQFLGPRRQARPGIAFEDLPTIDLVLVSHTHYDHLDRRTILKLGDAPQYIVPTGVARWFTKERIKNVTELSWWQSTTVRALAIYSVPAKHWSMRWILRKEEAGWGGYVIESPAGGIYFVGDTAYDESYFKQIGERFLDIAVALIPIGAYHPRHIFQGVHIDPQEAVIIHQEVGAKQSIGMHWGVFKMTEEKLHEPPLQLMQEVAAARIPPEEFSVMKFGETKIL